MLNAFVLMNSLPTLQGIQNWGLTIAGQFVTLVVIFLVAKYLVRLKVGSIIGACVLGGAVTFVIQNWNTVSSWVDALISRL
ncbi:hypothetical protein NST67_15050 [Bacillus sp. FSL W7-1321]